MGVGFTRRYTFDPGLTEILKIEGVVIISRAPPGLVIGTGTGCALCVAEFEDGPFEKVTEVLGSSDLLNQFGGFGFTYDAVDSNNPCARARYADGQVAPEYWNGNGFIALGNKQFARLLLCRVDTSVGSVQFTRLGAVSGGSGFTFDLEPAQVLGVKLNGGGATSVTFNATAATKNSAAGTYPSTFAGGESITYKIDGNTYTTVFLVGDQTQTQVIARLNATVGFAAFVNAGGNVTTLNGRQRGSGGSVQIVSVSGALVTTATGFSAGAAQAGTGNVANIDQVTRTELKTIIEGAVAGTLVDTDSNNAIRISNTGTPATGTIAIDSATTTALGLGFPLDTVFSAAASVDGTIPAGTRVQTAGGVVFVTMQTIAIAAANAGPYSVKVRHAVDDGTGASQLTAAINAMTGPVLVGAFAVSNPLPTAAALTEGAIDAKYITAIDKTRATSNVSKQDNLIWSARTSNAIRSRLRQNALDASGNGCQGRIAHISPPLGTSRVIARSTSAQPGMGAYRSQRVVYNYPGVSTYFPQIAARGTAGGAGFTANGNIDVHSDGFAVSLESQLPPEENPGQQTDFMFGALGIESNNPDVQDLTEDDYVAFRAAGIMAPRFDDGDAFFQSGIVNVDPIANAAVKNVNRQRMADFIEDTLAVNIMPFDKKLGSIDRRAQVVSQIRSFLSDLKGAPGKTAQRIADFSVDPLSGNTKDSIAAGVFRVLVKVMTIASMDVIVFDVQVGETVVIEQLTSLAA
jgi:hypothetical protein